LLLWWPLLLLLLPRRWCLPLLWWPLLLLPRRWCLPSSTAAPTSSWPLLLPPTSGRSCCGGVVDVGRVWLGCFVDEFGEGLMNSFGQGNKADKRLKKKTYMKNKGDPK
jgi:hypothetical protein